MEKRLLFNRGSGFPLLLVAALITIKLVNFYIGINFPHEYVRSHVANRAADDAEGTGEQRHVAEVERRLEKAVHSVDENEKKSNKLGT